MEKDTKAFNRPVIHQEVQKIITGPILKISLVMLVYFELKMQTNLSDVKHFSFMYQSA